jgi:hypothetical protein
MAVGAEGDHLRGIVAVAKGEVVDVVDLQDRLAASMPGERLTADDVCLTVSPLRPAAIDRRTTIRNHA